MYIYDITKHDDITKHGVMKPQECKNWLIYTLFKHSIVQIET